MALVLGLSLLVTTSFNYPIIILTLVQDSLLIAGFTSPSESKTALPRSVPAISFLNSKSR